MILETGGGLKAALPLLGDGPVLTLNTDAVWSGQNPLTQLLEGWDPAKMDALLLLLPAEKALGHAGNGDFLLDDQGRIARANGAKAPIYLGAQILKTEGTLRNIRACFQPESSVGYRDSQSTRLRPAASRRLVRCRSPRRHCLGRVALCLARKPRASSPSPPAPISPQSWSVA